MNNLSVSLDGIIFSLQNYGGISVYYKELLKYLYKNKIHTNLFINDRFKYSYVDLTNYSPIILPKRIFERFRDFPVINLGNSIFHSSYFRIPNSKKIPVVITVYDFISEKYPSIKSKAFLYQKQKAIARADSIICISESTKNDLYYYCKIRNNQNVYVIPCGVSEKFNLNNPKLNNYDNYFIYIGNRFAEYKNFKIALEILKRNPSINLYCVGGGFFSKKELSTLNHKDFARIKHITFSSEDELAQLYKKAICLIYPSKYEGFGIPVIEAMRCGCPVVAGPCKAIIEFSGQAIIKAEDFSIDAFDIAFKKALCIDRINYIELGIRLSAGFTWQSVHANTLNVYSNLFV